MKKELCKPCAIKLTSLGYKVVHVYGKNEKEIRPMASTTKIMTCILALELGRSTSTKRREIASNLHKEPGERT